MFKVSSSQGHYPVILNQCRAKKNHGQGVALQHTVEYLRADPRQMGWVPFPTEG